MKVGVIGLGSMGMGAALNLHRKGHAVTGCEPRETARAEFAAAQGKAVASADQLPADLEAVVVFVINAAQTEDVLFGPARCLAKLEQRRGHSVLLHRVARCRAIVGQADRGRGLPDARLAGFGRQERRARRDHDGHGLRLRRGFRQGRAGAARRFRPRSGGWAREIGVGSTVKMVNQLLAGVHIATAAEALALGIRAGADPKTLFEVISELAGSSWMWQNRVPHILAGDDSPSSAVNIFVKDLGIVLDQARGLTFPLPMASAAHQLFLAAAANGEGYKDDAFVIRVWQALTGIELPKG